MIYTNEARHDSQLIIFIQLSSSPFLYFTYVFQWIILLHPLRLLHMPSVAELTFEMKVQIFRI
jgi:hypothetical protein